MPNILFIGVPEKDTEELINCLIELLPEDMDDAVYKAYPADAPVFVKTKETAPYVIIRDSDHTRAERIKDALQKGIDRVDGPLDVEIDIISFYSGGGVIIEEQNR